MENIEKDLMLGDWVFMKLKTQTRYVADKVMSLSHDGFLEYQPIPLTEEILKDNGWDTAKYNGGVSSQLETDGGKTCITIDRIHHDLAIRLDDICYCFPTPRYVHEFQNALRLCGLNELADDFKVLI